MFHSRDRNTGWRIDYFLISKDMENQIQEAKIHTQILGSDHCPIELDFSF
jgi:exodeoxyribonuclease-3